MPDPTIGEKINITNYKKDQITDLLIKKGLKIGNYQEELNKMLKEQDEKYEKLKQAKESEKKSVSETSTQSKKKEVKKNENTQDSTNQKKAQTE